MELPIHKVSLGRDSKAYVCFKVPALTALAPRGAQIQPESEYVTARFPAEAMETLVHLLKEERLKRR